MLHLSLLFFFILPFQFLGFIGFFLLFFVFVLRDTARFPVYAVLLIWTIDLFLFRCFFDHWDLLQFLGAFGYSNCRRRRRFEWLIRSMSSNNSNRWLIASTLSDRNRWMICSTLISKRRWLIGSSTLNSVHPDLKYWFYPRFG